MRITVTDIRLQTVNQILATSHGEGTGKDLVFRYDVGRKRLYWVVREFMGEMRESTFDTLEEAVDAYNDAR